MHPELASRFEALEVRREAMADRTRALSPEKQSAHPAKGEFSPLELLQHMALAEKHDVGLMEKCGPKELQGRTSKTSFIYRHAIKSMEAAKRLPTMGKMVPKGSITVDQAAEEWKKVRASVRGFLDQVTEPSDPVMKSILGTLSAADLLHLFEAHMNYHEVRFPKV